MGLPDVETMSLSDLLSARAEMIHDVFPMLEMFKAIGMSGDEEPFVEARNFLKGIETELTKHGMQDTSEKNVFDMSLEEIQMELSGLGVYGAPKDEKYISSVKLHRDYACVTGEMQRIIRDGGDRTLLLEGRQVLLAVEMLLAQKGETL